MSTDIKEEARRMIDQLPEDITWDDLVHEIHLRQSACNGNAVERESWLQLSGRRLEEAYGDHEEEYMLDLIKEANPEYEGR